MIGYYEDKNYKSVARDLYEHEVLNYKEYETILDIDKSIEEVKEKAKTNISRNNKLK